MEGNDLPIPFECTGPNTPPPSCFSPFKSVPLSLNAYSDRLTRLINDVLDLARYEAGQEIWNDAPNSLSDIVETAVSGIQFLAIRKSLDISVDLESDLSDVWCDQDKINRVLTNLFSNAIKFTPEHGKMGILISEASNSGGKKSERMVEIKVSDNGVGIPTGELDEIFQKFKQVTDTLADVRKGTGLGLPICKEIVSHYGGKIWAESKLGEGSVFTVTIPIEKSAVAVDSPPAQESGSSSASSV